jgi:hypothetical protein
VLPRWLFGCVTLAIYYQKWHVFLHTTPFKCNFLNGDYMLYETVDYSIRLGKMEKIEQCLFFSLKFGRNCFEEIYDRQGLGEAIAYISKYIEKSGEKVVYSKNLPQYFVSDIWEEDIVCNIGIEERKLLLFDDFTCWDEGVYMGVVSPEIIALMPKANS